MYNLLIIDHNQRIRTLLSEYFDRTMAGSCIYRASNLQVGVDILETHEIDIVFMGSNTMRSDVKCFSDKVRKMNRVPLIVFLLPEQEAMLSQQIAELEDMPIGHPNQSKFTQPLLRFEKNTHKEAIMLSTAIGVYPVDKDSIVAIERTHRNSLNVYTPKRMFKKVRGTLSDISKQLPIDFVFINRQCIVNRTAITRIIPKTREIYLDVDSNEVTFSCSRDKIKDIITWFESLNPHSR